MQDVTIPAFNLKLQVPISSDVEGFFGHRCPACSKYFRSERCASVSFCPYCPFRGPSDSFRTENQKKFIQLVINSIFSALDEQKSKTLKLDDLVAGMEKTEAKILATERQQLEVTCDSPDCSEKYDIMGTFGRCPRCARRNNLQHLMVQTALLMERIENPRYQPSQKVERGNEWRDIVKGAISDYEGFTNDLRSWLIKIPSTPKRKRQIEEISFQQIVEAGARLLEYFGIDPFRNITEVDKKFVTRLTQARHLLEHRGGVVDEEYVNKSGDKSVRLGQKIRIDSNEAKRLIVIVEVLAQNIFDEFHSIK